jgi:hypothetical protein
MRSSNTASVRRSRLQFRISLIVCTASISRLRPSVLVRPAGMVPPQRSSAEISISLSLFQFPSGVARVHQKREPEHEKPRAIPVLGRVIG